MTRYILTQNGKPIYSTPLDTINYWTVLKMLVPDASIDEWMSNSTVRGLYADKIFTETGVVVWQWSEINNDFIQINKQ